MDIYLVRHTTPDVAPGTCYGHSDIDVAQSFPAELAALQAKLGHLQAPVIYSSPLQRCLKLAQSVATTFSPALSIQQDARLKELNFGDWEMQAWDQIPRGLVDVWSADFVRHVPPNGESFLQLAQRAQAFLSELQPVEQPMLVFTHAGVIRALTGHALALPLEHTFKLQVDYAGVTKIVIKDQLTHVAYINR